MLAALRRSMKPVRMVARRTFATEAKAPLRLYGPGAIYSNALFETIVEENGDYKKVSANLKDWSTRLDSDPELRLFAEDTTVNVELRQSTLAEIAEHTGYDDYSLQMIEAMMENQATVHLADIIQGFDDLTSHHFNDVRAVVTSAEALTDAQASQVSTKLQSLAGDSNLSITHAVDPSLIGGLTIEMGSKFQDLSVRTAIGACERAMRAAA